MHQAAFLVRHQRPAAGRVGSAGIPAADCQTRESGRYVAVDLVGVVNHVRVEFDLLTRRWDRARGGTRGGRDFLECGGGMLRIWSDS